jgi:hypothetical protein
MLASTIVTACSKAYPSTLGAPIPNIATDAARHGTGVAGVALYGDIARCVASKTFEPAALIINARLLDDDLALDPDRMPFVRQNVEHLDPSCRIFNLSFGLEPCSTVGKDPPGEDPPGEDPPAEATWVRIGPACGDTSGAQGKAHGVMSI